MPSFYFEQVLQTALNGIDQNVTGPVLQLAGVILILSLALCSLRSVQQWRRRTGSRSSRHQIPGPRLGLP